MQSSSAENSFPLVNAAAGIVVCICALASCWIWGLIPAHGVCLRALYLTWASSIEFKVNSYRAGRTDVLQKIVSDTPDTKMAFGLSII